jgi:hypothetical protein
MPFGSFALLMRRRCLTLSERRLRQQGRPNMSFTVAQIGTDYLELKSSDGGWRFVFLLDEMRASRQPQRPAADASKTPTTPAQKMLEGAQRAAWDYAVAHSLI